MSSMWDMKKHFGKQLTEAPRAGGKAYGDKALRKLLTPRASRDLEADVDEHLPKHVRRSMYRAGSKRFTDVLGPLEAYLKAQVGRRWDDVFSELCESIDRRSMTGRHLMEHVKGFVVRDVVMLEGTPHRLSRFGGGGYTPLGSYRRDQLYVDPDTQRLAVAPRADLWQLSGGRPAKLLTHAQRCLNRPWPEARDKLSRLRHPTDKDRAPNDAEVLYALFGWRDVDHVREGTTWRAVPRAFSLAAVDQASSARPCFVDAAGKLRRRKT